MCGINGFNFKNRKLIGKMNNLLVHKRNDISGSYNNNGVSLGYQRLPIVDLSKQANQPMFREGIGIVYDGEIYNFKELREELRAKGYDFTTNSDTEVILFSYIEWGFSCINKFNGMWAFCIYDTHKNLFFLSRDRFGQKSLYYYFKNDKFIFSSEIKSIIEYINPIINKEGVDLFLSMGFIPAPYSIYQDTYKLEAGTNLIFNLENYQLKKKRYYKVLVHNPVFNKSALIKEGRKILKDAISLRLQTDVEVGFLLSGGLDSSTLVYFSKNHLKPKTKSFSSIFTGSNNLRYIKKVVKDIDLDSKTYNFKDFDFENKLNELLYYFDEPFVDYSMFSTYDICENASKYLKVCLSGDGGDEVFGGYWNYKIILLIDLLKRFPVFLRKWLIKLVPEMIGEAIKISFLKPEEIYSEGISTFYKPRIFKKLSKNKMKEMLKASNNNLVEAIMSYDKFFRTLGDNYVHRLDRCSMANSLEIRSPFLDYRLMEFSSKIPTKWKVNLIRNRSLMRKIINGIVPEFIINRKKEGFSPDMENIIYEYYENPKIHDMGENIKIGEMIFELQEKNIISEDWEDFLFHIALKNKKIYGRFIVRIVFLYYWVKFWYNKNV